MDAIIEKFNEAGLRTVYAGSTRGGEYHAPCPFCLESTGNEGKDRLCIWPAEGRAWCRRCESRASLTVLYAKLVGVSEAKAQRLLSGSSRPPVFGSRPDLHRLASPETWQNRVVTLIRSRANALFTEECATQLDYLNARGLHEDTIVTARLGGCFENRFHDRKEFGLVPELKPESDQPRRICIPEGILIPYFDVEGVCRCVQFRCEDGLMGRYRVLAGSKMISMILLPQGNVRAVVVVESALDALLCHQEVPKTFAFVALGSSVYHPDAAADALLRSVPHVLIATDSDEAGALAFRHLSTSYPNASRLIVPPDSGKDIGEAYVRGLPIAEWCDIGLDRAKHAATRPETVCEGPSQTEHAAPATEVTEVWTDVPYKLVTSRKHAGSAVKVLLAAEYVAVDIETAPLPKYAGQKKAALDPWRARPRLLQAATGGTVYVFDLNKVPLADLAPLFRSLWVAHNAVFDYKHLLQAELDPEPDSPYCTMLCDNALTNESRSLDDLFKVYFGIRLDKELQSSDWSAGELSEAQLQYAARDAVAVLRLWERLRCEVAERDRKKLAQLLHDAQRAVALMEINGLGFDIAAHAKAVKAWRREQKCGLTALRELAGDDLNPNSHPQLAEFLEAGLTKAQLRDWPRTGSGQLSTAAREIAAFRGVPAVDLLLDYRRWSDLLGKFGEKLSGRVNPVTGRLHPHFRIAGARTGRMSASDPNVQGLPHDTEFRRLFVAQEGHVLVRADYNQMQLRVAAMLSGDARLLDAYEKGSDVHRLTAARLLGKRPAAVTGGERALAKAIAFGILFGIGPKALRGYALNNYGVQISTAEAARVRDRFFETYPDVRRWQLEQVEEADRTSCSVTPMGRVRNFTREDKADFHTAAMNTPIQGGEGEVMLAALALLPDALDPLDGLLVNCVHDEILVECPEASAGDVETALRDCMERGMRAVFPDASLNGLVEAGHGPTWADAK